MIEPRGDNTRWQQARSVVSAERGCDVERTPSQYVVTAALVFAALWIAVIAFGRVDLATVVLPVLGPVPTPLLLLAGGLAAGYVLARLLGAHARWLSRRWSGRMRRAITVELEPRLGTAALAALDAIDAARARLAHAYTQTRED